MNTLWSPWRSEYIGAPSHERSESCFLCDSASQVPSAHNLVLGVTEHLVMLMNKFPYNAGHILIAPRIHTGDFAALHADVAHELITLSQKAVAVVQDTLKPHGFNLGFNLGSAAGAGVPDHLHFHIVPRWNGDTNFMPVVGEVKVASQETTRIWQQYRSCFIERGYIST